MLYNELYLNLKTAFDKLDSSITLDDLSIKISQHEFISESIDKDLTKSQSYQRLFKDECNLNSFSPISNINRIDDCKIKENSQFNYYIFENTDSEKHKGAIFLFHGLNEKKWDKYLPWAYTLARNTGKTVIVLPLSFHMNRAPPLHCRSPLLKSWPSDAQWWKR